MKPRLKDTSKVGRWVKKEWAVFPRTYVSSKLWPFLRKKEPGFLLCCTNLFHSWNSHISFVLGHVCLSKMPLYFFFQNFKIYFLISSFTLSTTYPLCMYLFIFVAGTQQINQSSVVKVHIWWRKDYFFPDLAMQWALKSCFEGKHQPIPYAHFVQQKTGLELHAHIIFEINMKNSTYTWMMFQNIPCYLHHHTTFFFLVSIHCAKFILQNFFLSLLGVCKIIYAGH